MCIYTDKNKFFKKNPQEGCSTPPNVPKLGVSGVKVTAKTNVRGSRDKIEKILVIFLVIFFLLLNCVYAHILNLNYEKKLILKST